MLHCSRLVWCYTRGKRSQSRNLYNSTQWLTMQLSQQLDWFTAAMTAATAYLRLSPHLAISHSGSTRYEICRRVDGASKTHNYTLHWIIITKLLLHPIWQIKCYKQIQTVKLNDSKPIALKKLYSDEMHSQSHHYQALCLYKKLVADNMITLCLVTSLLHPLSSELSNHDHHTAHSGCVGPSNFIHNKKY